MSTWIVAHLWLIPAIPLAAVARRSESFELPPRGRGAASPSPDRPSRSFSRSAPSRRHLQTPGYRGFQNFTWFTFGEQTLRLGFVLDPLAAAMLVMITFVSLCIFVFSIGYMAADKNFTRFFAYLSFFSAAMLGVVIANSLLLLFVCWELVGLASYLLIGFWIDKPSAAAAAKKAFITTRIGDIGFFLGILWLYGRSGTLLFYDGGNGALESAGLLSLGASATFIALLIFCGAVGKSGQFPLHVWLPDAMEGPTPVSALIHAATMVAAGVFLVARVYPLFSLGAIHGVTTSLTVVVWIGVITALMSALIALAQSDIKRILAYSTVSQLGLMMVSLGVGGVAAGIMHLLAHGFFQGAPLPRLRFRDSRLSRGTGHPQDGRLARTHAGDVPDLRHRHDDAERRAALFLRRLDEGGNPARDLALGPSRVPHYLMLAGVILTALYMTRQMIYVFFGEPARRRRTRTRARRHDLPLIVLALCSIVFSVVLTPAWPWLHDYLSGERADFEFGLAHPARAFIFRSSWSRPELDLGFWSTERPARGSRSSSALRFFSLSRKQDVAGRTLRLDDPRVRRASPRALSDWMDRYIWDGLVRLSAESAGLLGILSEKLRRTGDQRRGRRTPPRSLAVSAA